MALKNWTITAASVKKGRDGLIAYSNYLVNKNSHKNQKIIEITSRKKTIYKQSVKADNFNLKRKMSSGGRPSNYAWSSVFSYPFEIEEEKLKKLFLEISKDFIKYISLENELGFSEEEIKKIVENEVLGVIHKGENINNHIHAIFPKHFLKNKKLISIDLSKKKYLHRLKLINNQKVAEIANIELFDYEVKAKEKQTKRLSKSKAKQKQNIEKANKTVLKDTNNLFKELKKQLYKAIKLENNEEKMKELKRLDRAEKQLKNGNTIRAAKTLNKK